MEYTVNQLANLAGVTTRTLRYYDRIGLLAPERVTSAGYRIYGLEQVDRLQQVLFYRELGFELSQIREILDNPDFDVQTALQEHLIQLHSRRNRLSGLIATAERTLQTVKGENTMTDQEKFEGFKQKLVEENERSYGAEIREKYGDVTVNASNAKTMKMTPKEYAAFQETEKELCNALRSAVPTGDATSPEAEHVARLHRQWLEFTWPQYSAEAHRGLVQMYVEDERFAAYYEAIASGAAAFLRDAVLHWLEE